MKKPFSVWTIILAASLLLLQLAPLCSRSNAAAGDVDLSFDPGSGVNGFVWAVATQPDGRVIVGGTFTTVKGLSRTNLARLNADGSGDATFNSGVAFSAVDSLALQSDSKLLVGGTLAQFECDEFGCYPTTIARLHPDGSRDESFVPAAVPTGNVYCIASQPDGKVLLGGDFETVNGTNRGGIARLNANGGLDSTFNPGSGVFGYPGGVRCLAVQSDGRVLMGGGFTAVNGTNRGGIARLNANGSLDSTFNPGTGLFAPYGIYAFSIAVQPDGKALIGGNFTSVNGTNRNGIARLNTNGSLDSSFDPGTGARDNPSSYYGVGVKSVVLQPDGKVLIGGDFTTVNGTNRGGIARLNPNGSLDLGFNPDTFVLGGYGTSVALQSDGKLFIAANRIARLNANGSVDSSFDPGSFVYDASSLALQPDGKILLGGNGVVTFQSGTNHYGSRRLNANGSSDGTFVPGSFNPAIGDLGFPYDVRQITTFAIQADGRVLVAAYYYELAGCDDAGCLTLNSYSITRHQTDGSRDNSFDPVVRNSGSAYLEYVNSLAVQPDGRIVVGGIFYSIKGENRNSLARLNANGSLDNSFIGAVPFNYQITRAVAQPDGKVMIAGNFPSIYGVPRHRIARLNLDGSLDAGFNPGAGISNSSPVSNLEIRAVAVQPDGRTLIGGDFTSVTGTNRNGIARLNLDGSLDVSFNPGSGANGRVSAIVLQPDGNVLIGGEFTTVNGVVRPHVARLYGDSAVPSLGIARSNEFFTVSWPVTGLNFQLQESTNLSLPNSWSPVGQPAVTNSNQISVTVPTASGNRFFRLKSQ